jgi:hypothetical protein
VGAVPGEELVQELLPRRHLPREQLGREQPFEEVVVAEVAVTPREADRARDGERLEYARTAFSGSPNQFLVGPAERSKSSDDSGPSARIRASTRSATAALSARAAAAGDGDRVGLDRSEPSEDLQHPVAAGERPRRREEVPGDEEATRRLGSHPHR